MNTNPFYIDMLRDFYENKRQVPTLPIILPVLRQKKRNLKKKT